MVVAPQLAPASATAPPDEPLDEAPHMILAPVDPLLQDGDGLDLELTIDNPSADATEATTVEVLLTTQPIGTRYSLSRWFDGEAFMASSAIATVEVPAVDALDRETVRTSIDAEALGLDGRAWGPYGLAASGAAFGSATSVVVRDEPGEASPTTVALSAPIDSRVGASGLLTADQLEAATEPGGQARTALDAALGADATIGIDPAFGASEAALGDEAPEAATDWLDRADTPASHPLLYANADPIAQVRAGAYPLEPLGIPREDDDPLPATAGSVGTRSPVIDATRAIVRQGELESLAGAGTVVLSTAALDEQLGGSTPSAHVRVDGVDVLAADAQLQELVRAAAEADEESAADARAQVVALLATITRERPSDPRTLAAVLAPPSSGDSAPLLADLAEAQFVETAGLDTALEATPREATLVETDDPQRNDGAALVADALEQESEASRVASIVDEPAALLAELRLAVLAALPDAGREVTEADRVAIENLGGTMSEVRNAVQLVGGSDIHAVGESVGLPITITNELDVPANVVLTVRPTNALVSVPEPRIDVTIAPTSQQRVQVPVDVVGTGTLLMVVQLHTPDGVPLGQIQQLHITAQPTIEVAVAWTLGIAIVLLLGFGILRSIQKRRRGQARGDIDDLAREHRDQEETA
ncbi:hypothetical protein ABA31_21960 [Agrococcus baldri]|uniref:Glycoprotein n=2 Tax=Agrococcus baldri TaxID=153730 RepID=A0AA87RIG7_9MICO|nr:hypothetical protein ABA31_21960 [Agrococcus baldri]